MNFCSADEIIKYFGLIKHPEGGYYREIYRSDNSFDRLPKQFSGSRNYMTSIYFLLKSGDKSLFHRLKSDEIWYFHLGTPLKFHLINEQGSLKSSVLGDDFLEGEQLQVSAPAGCFMAAEVISPESFSFISCAVAPGFDFADFEMGDKKSMTQNYPSHADLIDKFTN